MNAVADSLRAIVDAHDRSQWWSAEDLDHWQLARIGELLAHAYRHSPACRARLGSAGYVPGSRVTRDLWRSIPVMERGDLQRDGAGLRCGVIPAAQKGVFEVATSGSTAMPVHVLRTSLSAMHWHAITMRDHAWHRRDFSRTLGAIRWFADGVAAYPEGARWPNWTPPVSLLHDSGASFGLSVTATDTQQVEWLQRVQPEYLILFPSLLPNLARECDRQGVQLDRLKQIRTVGECLDDDTRALCRRQWDVPVQDMYSAQEVGYIALQCPDHDHYHVQAENVRVEVLDAGGQPCRTGEVGRVVVTPLHSFAMPLIRYAIGDHAEVGAACPCGRGLPVLRRVLGRTRNMLALPDGGHVWPRLSELRYNDVLPVRQFQVVQKALDRLEVRLVADRGATGDEENRLRDMINARIGGSFDIGFSYFREIPRSASGKFEDFRSEMKMA